MGETKRWGLFGFNILAKTFHNRAKLEEKGLAEDIKKGPGGEINPS